MSAALDGLALVLAWPNILYPIAGTLLAMCVAVLPGISGATLMAIVIPLTFHWDTLQILLLFGALVGGATFMGSTTAILFNIPGTGPNAATLLDGYPMARQGRARTALACSALSSALGSTVGVFLLILLIPAVVVLGPRMGPPEYLMLSLWGLVCIVTVIRASVVKGLVMAGFGLLISLVGLDPMTAETRYTLGTIYLQDGVGLIPVFVGVFAIAEIIDLLATGRRTVSGETDVAALGGTTAEGVRAVFRHFGVFLRSSLIGTGIGVVPGVGGTVAGFVAYGEAARVAGKDGRFGEGDIRGVIAPEAANDAKDGGSLLPALAFGVPASAGTALLLVALQIHGVTPGGDLMTNDLDLVFVLIWSLFISNWLSSLLGLSLVGPLARLSVVRVSRLVPPILALSVIGAFAYRGRVTDVWLAFGFGAAGYAARRYGWPRIPFIIAIVLGPLFEVNLGLSLRLHELGRIDLWTRPSILLVGVLIALSVAVPRLPRRRGERS
ncbi:MAG: tripartite tricarboxylate transporter permease [Gemmatimonadota bacterium]|nr:tripartite tricarboxylate transporter permease [Gemmatimonadota bacterium]